MVDGDGVVVVVVVAVVEDYHAQVHEYWAASQTWPRAVEHHDHRPASSLKRAIPRRRTRTAEGSVTLESLVETLRTEELCLFSMLDLFEDEEKKLSTSVCRSFLDFVLLYFPE